MHRLLWSGLIALLLASLALTAQASSRTYQPWGTVYASTAPLTAYPHGGIVWSPITIHYTEAEEGKYEIWHTGNGGPGRVWFTTGHQVFWSAPLCTACPSVFYVSAGGVFGHADEIRVGVESTDPYNAATIWNIEVKSGQ